MGKERSSDEATDEGSNSYHMVIVLFMYDTQSKSAGAPGVSRGLELVLDKVAIMGVRVTLHM